VKHFHLLTSMGSNPNSWFLYPKTKGQVLSSLPSWPQRLCGCACNSVPALMRL
jgi:hypothetical protein